MYKSTTQSYNPAWAVTPAVWAPPLSLATTRGITFVLFSYGYLDVSVPHVRSTYHRRQCHVFNMAGCPIRISADLRSFAPTRGFSQLITSFFASKSLGIPRAPFVTFLTISASRIATQHQCSCYTFYPNMSMNFYHASWPPSRATIPAQLEDKRNLRYLYLKQVVLSGVEPLTPTLSV